MSSHGRIFGNRPDCAYYLLLALGGAAVFTALGGVFTYMGYWPESAFHHPHGGEPVSHFNGSSSHLKVSEANIQVYSIVGPFCLIIGAIILITVGVLAIKYDCEHEPEDAKVAIIRLASEVSLNLSTNGQDTSKYEMIRTANNGIQINNAEQQGPSGSNFNPRGVEIL